MSFFLPLNCVPGLALQCYTCHDDDVKVGDCNNPDNFKVSECAPDVEYCTKIVLDEGR